MILNSVILKVSAASFDSLVNFLYCYESITETLMKQSREMVFQLLEVAHLFWNWTASWRSMRNACLLEKIFVSVAKSIGSM